MTDSTKTTNLPSWCCPYCGKPVGWVGRALAWFVGVGAHGCDFRVYRAKHGPAADYAWRKMRNR